MGCMAEDVVRPGRLAHELVEDVGIGVYETAVTHGWIEDNDPSFAPGTPQRDALNLLTELGLLRHDVQASRYEPTDPSAASDQLVVPLAQQGSELLAESAQWTATIGKMSQVYRASSLSLQRAITEIHGFEAINRFIDSQLNDARFELLFAQPHGKRPANDLARAEQRDLRALERGVSMRTLYQHSARHSQATREYVAEMTVLGAETRTSDEFFRRLMIFDRHTALIPATQSHAVAVAIHDKSTVAFLHDLFERAWERALPFTVEGEAIARTIAEETRAMTVRMLVEGHSDVVSAKRLGVSARTYASYIAALKEEYGVETRFQLGWAMSRSQDGRLETSRPPSGEGPEQSGF